MDGREPHFRQLDSAQEFVAEFCGLTAKEVAIVRALQRPTTWQLWHCNFSRVTRWSSTISTSPPASRPGCSPVVEPRCGCGDRWTRAARGGPDPVAFAADPAGDNLVRQLLQRFPVAAGRNDRGHPSALARPGGCGRDAGIGANGPGPGGCRSDREQHPQVDSGDARRGSGRCAAAGRGPLDSSGGRLVSPAKRVWSRAIRKRGQPTGTASFAVGMPNFPAI